MKLIMEATSTWVNQVRQTIVWMVFTSLAQIDNTNVSNFLCHFVHLFSLTVLHLTSHGMTTKCNYPPSTPLPSATPTPKPVVIKLGLIMFL